MTLEAFVVAIPDSTLDGQARTAELDSNPASVSEGQQQEIQAATAPQPQEPQEPKYTLASACKLRDHMLEAAKQGFAALQTVLPAALACTILEDAFQLFKSEPTLLEINVQDPAVEVVVVGDTHGQFHDVCKLLELMGMPSSSRTYIFNGDFVDRGAWGVELVTLLLSLKLACPHWVHLVRGNHETSTCTKFYGFKGEVDAKFSPPAPPLPQQRKRGPAVPKPPEGVMLPMRRPHDDAKAVFKAFKKVFSMLPLAAVVQGKTLILHGGLFRRPHRSQGGKKGVRRPGSGRLEVGALEDLRGATKGGLDPDGQGSSVVAADVLWSDPVADPGIKVNSARGVGLTFGPDITERFLAANSLSLIIRSHEGPDARDKRTDLPSILSGYALDHVTPAGNLMTVFSAPDYPQFQDMPVRYNNKGAVAVLKAPSYCNPEFTSFDAYQPRPEAPAFYDYLNYPDTDEEISGEETDMPSCSALSGGSVLCSGSGLGSQAGGQGEAEEGGEAESCHRADEEGAPLRPLPAVAGAAPSSAGATGAASAGAAAASAGATGAASAGAGAASAGATGAASAGAAAASAGATGASSAGATGAAASAGAAGAAGAAASSAGAAGAAGASSSAAGATGAGATGAAAAGMDQQGAGQVLMPHPLPAFLAPAEGAQSTAHSPLGGYSKAAVQRSPVGRQGASEPAQVTLPDNLHVGSSAAVQGNPDLRIDDGSGDATQQAAPCHMPLATTTCPVGIPSEAYLTEPANEPAGLPRQQHELPGDAAPAAAEAAAMEARMSPDQTKFVPGVASVCLLGGGHGSGSEAHATHAADAAHAAHAAHAAQLVGSPVGQGQLPQPMPVGVQEGLQALSGMEGACFVHRGGGVGSGKVDQPCLPGSVQPSEDVENGTLPYGSDHSPDLLRIEPHEEGVKRSRVEAGSDATGAGRSDEHHHYHCKRARLVGHAEGSHSSISRLGGLVGLGPDAVMPGERGPAGDAGDDGGQGPLQAAGCVIAAAPAAGPNAGGGSDAGIAAAAIASTVEAVQS